MSRSKTHPFILGTDIPVSLGGRREKWSLGDGDRPRGSKYRGSAINFRREPLEGPPVKSRRGGEGRVRLHLLLT